MTLCDAHIHVVADPVGMIPNRSYTPPPAPLAELQRAAAPLGIGRFVVVQPSFYGTDNSVTLEALAQLGESGAGVAVIDPDQAGDAELAALDAARVRGLRINLYSTHGAAPAQSLAERFGALAAVAERMRWHVQVIADLPVLLDAADILAEAPVPVVIDHYGLPQGFAPETAEGARLLDLAARPHVWVKLSAPYRSTGDVLGITPDPMWLRALLEAAPGRCVWGSDWPHTPPTEAVLRAGEPAPYRPIRYSAMVAAFRSAVGAQAAETIMGDNPARLYGFEKP